MCWPSRCRDGQPGEKGSRQDFRQLDQITEGIAEEGEAAADCQKLERLGHDGDAARPQFLDSGVDACDIQAEMVVAGIFEAIAEIGIRATSAGAGSPPPRIST